MHGNMTKHNSFMLTTELTTTAHQYVTRAGKWLRKKPRFLGF